MPDITPVEPVRLIQYEDDTQALNAFLDAWQGDAGYDRRRAAAQAGLSYDKVCTWFEGSRAAVTLAALEGRLEQQARKRSSYQDDMLSASEEIVTANIADLFETNPETGLPTIRNIADLPRRVTSAIKQLDLIRTTVPGGKRGEFQECLRIVMHDKVQMAKLLGDFTGVKEKLTKEIDTGAPKAVGLSLVLADPRKQLDTDDKE